MSMFWERGNVWLDLPTTSITRFSYMSWKRFMDESPFESIIWQRRGIRLLSWGTKMDMNHRVLQIIFLATIPELEYFTWEMAVKDEEAEFIQKWLSERKPSFWNF